MAKPAVIALRRQGNLRRYSETLKRETKTESEEKQRRKRNKSSREKIKIRTNLKIQDILGRKMNKERSKTAKV